MGIIAKKRMFFMKQLFESINSYLFIQLFLFSNFNFLKECEIEEEKTIYRVIWMEIQIGNLTGWRSYYQRKSKLKFVSEAKPCYFLLYFFVRMQGIKEQVIGVNRGQENFRKKSLKLKLAETVYICECGKNFLSFPAIYSHAKQKHGRKLSSKLDSGAFRRVLENNQQKVYFKSSEDDDVLENPSSKQATEFQGKNISNKVLNFKIITKMNKMSTPEGKPNVYGAICRYLESLTPSIVGEELVEISDTLLVLTQCLNSHYMIYDQRAVQTNYCRDTTPEKVPLFLNFLVTWYVPSCIEKLTIKLNLDIFCSYLKHFCSWLGKEKLTGYNIEVNEQKTQFPKSQNDR